MLLEKLNLMFQVGSLISQGAISLVVIFAFIQLNKMVKG